MVENQRLGNIWDSKFRRILSQASGKNLSEASAAKNPKIRIRMGHFSSDVFEKLLTRLLNQGETQSFTRPETAETSGGYIQCSSQRNQPNQLREWGNSRRKKGLLMV